MTTATTPLIIGHRGAAGEAPENTLASFKLALEQHCDGIELDIHLSKDGELVVIHDYTVRRTTDGTGAVNELTVSELKRFDAGLWFHEKYEGERIPLLEEVFDLVPPRVMINVEIKNSYNGAVEPKLLELMIRKNRMENTVVSSFKHKSLLRLKQLEPAVKIGLLYDSDLVHHRKYAELFGVSVYSLHPHYKSIERDDVADAVRHGMQVYPYTVNDPDEMRIMIDKGVTGLITDYPGRLHALLDGQLI